GRMPEEKVLMEYIVRQIGFPKDLAGKKVLVTAGATREAIDPVRFITNHSSGRMGCAVARAAMLRGADVTLVCAHMDGDPPMCVKAVPGVSAAEMADAVLSAADEQDIIIKAAAVSDYPPVTTSASKIKKSDSEMSDPLKRTRDILKALGEKKRPG